MDIVQKMYLYPFLYSNQVKDLGHHMVLEPFEGHGFHMFHWVVENHSTYVLAILGRPQLPQSWVLPALMEQIPNSPRPLLLLTFCYY